jgi:hypothetical protein
METSNLQTMTVAFSTPVPEKLLPATNMYSKPLENFFLSFWTIWIFENDAYLILTSTICCLTTYPEASEA